MRVSPEGPYRRIGLFGGTFDPPHWGHVKTARGAADELALDELAFLPAVQPPHKRHRRLTPFALRRQMLECLLPLDPRFRLCLVEAERSLPGTTLETVEALRRQGFTEDRCHLVWLMGSDSLLELESWHRPDDLLESIEVAVLPRPGYPPEQAPERFRSRVRLLATPLVDLAAQDIRAGRIPLEEAVPPPVARFIRQHRLYR